MSMLFVLINASIKGTLTKSPQRYDDKDMTTMAQDFNVP